MARRPLGTYTRPTGDWFRHTRARTWAQIDVTGEVVVAIGLHNDDQSGRFCYVIGITAGILTPSSSKTALSLLGDYYQSPGSPLGPTETLTQGRVGAWFDQDAPPLVHTDGWYDSGDPTSKSLMLPLAPVTDPRFPLANLYYTSQALTYYPDGGVAAIKSGRGFYIAAPSTAPLNTLTVMFDFVMLPD